MNTRPSPRVVEVTVQCPACDWQGATDDWDEHWDGAHTPKPTEEPYEWPTRGWAVSAYWTAPDPYEAWSRTFVVMINGLGLDCGTVKFLPLGVNQYGYAVPLINVSGVVATADKAGRMVEWHLPKLLELLLLSEIQAVVGS
jgi:hypothetical protein